VKCLQGQAAECVVSHAAVNSGSLPICNASLAIRLGSLHCAACLTGRLLRLRLQRAACEEAGGWRQVAWTEISRRLHANQHALLDRRCCPWPADECPPNGLWAALRRPPTESQTVFGRQFRRARQHCIGRARSSCSGRALNGSALEPITN
jgi:hypothetical protein